MSKNYFKFILLITVIIGISSCKKETEDVIYSQLSIVNMSPTVATYDVYLNDGKINAAALPFGGSISYGQKQISTYTLKFTTPNRPENLFSKSIDIAQSAYYT